MRFLRATVVVAPGEVRRYDAADWRDAIVTVGEGEIALEGVSGCSRTFGRGDMFALADVPLRALRNPGAEPALLVAVSRRRQSMPSVRRSSTGSENEQLP